MTRIFHESKTFENMDYSGQIFPAGDYEECIFIKCSFAHGDLRGSNLGDCDFVDCDLSLANLSGITLRDTRFKSCKLLGLKFEDCNGLLFSPVFEHCQLDLASFFRCMLAKTIFTDCSMREVDFTESNLSGAEFLRCDLLNAVFLHTNLEKSDLRTAVHFSIDPEKNRLARARFSHDGLSGLLEKYDLRIE